MVPGDLRARRLVAIAIPAGSGDLHLRSGPQDRLNQEGVQEAAGSQRRHGGVGDERRQRARRGPHHGAHRVRERPRTGAARVGRDSRVPSCCTPTETAAQRTGRRSWSHSSGGGRT